MPTYEYKCNSCKETFEDFHKITEDPEMTCPKCKSDDVRKIISGGTGFIIKGGGAQKKSVGQRHGHKKGWSQPTPGESAKAKGQKALKEAQHNEAMNKDPYYQHRS